MGEIHSVSKPKSKFGYLVQQVKEQSPLCDFTLKVGFSTKRYHRCVLVTCPYFDKAVRGNFIEKQKGLVDIGVGTPYTVDAAIMYLYGIVPDINIYNVEQLLEQAEYFMLSGLKSTCINRIRSLKITDSNYMYILKLSSVYNFEVPACMTYIESHLPEVFITGEALHFSKELVKKLFSDERLSYVTMDEKLWFLMQWVSRNANETKASVTHLFEMIDINDVTELVWQQVSQDCLLNEKVDLRNAVRWYHGSEYKNDVLITTGKKKGYFLCLNLQNNKWYELNTSLQEDSYDDCLRYIAGIRNTKPEVYFTKDEEYKMHIFATFNHMKPTFTTLNIETNERNEYKFTLKDDDILKETITRICLAENTLLVLTRKHVRIIETYANGQTENGTHHDNFTDPTTSNNCSESSRRRVRISVICDNERLYPSQMINEENFISVDDTIHTAVHVGNVTKGLVEIIPIFYLRNIIISEICVNSILSTIAFLPKEKDSVILFDLINFKMEKISLVHDALYTLSTTNRGFVIYNNRRCYCLTALYWSLPSQQYLVELFELKTDDKMLEFLFCNGFWLRFYMLDFEMSYVRHEELLKSKCPKELNWKYIPMPDEIFENILAQYKGLFVVQLSKRKLRCHIACPHCKYLQQENSSLTY